jgi:carbon-monoxide dehydrogenase medium subunit
MTVKAFFSPSSVDEAVALMHSQPGRGAYLAGGTDLLCEKDWPDYVVNVRDLLNQVKQDGDEFVIGASATLSQLEDWDELKAHDDGLIFHCTQEFGSRHIRNMATVGGNLANAVPSSDLALPLMALDAQCVIQQQGGGKTVPIAEFFTGPRQSVLEKGLLTEVRFPKPAANTYSDFQKICYNPGAIALINVAASIVLDGNTVQTARIALGSVAPTPVRALEAEVFLVGQAATEENFVKAGELAQNAAKPISDQRASAEYRLEMVKVLTKRALANCARRGQ